MSIEIEGNAVRCTVDASEDGAIRSYEVTMRVTASSIEHVRAGEFASRLLAGHELRALRATVREMADLILEQNSKIERLEEELDEGIS